MAARTFHLLRFRVARERHRAMPQPAYATIPPARMQARTNAPMTTVAAEPTDQGSAPGRVVVSARAIGSVAYQATLGCYGIVALVPQNLRSRVSRRLGHPPPPDAREGIAVQMDGDRVTVTLHVVVEYGLPIAAVAHNAIRTVYFAIEHAFGIRPVAVNVHVHELRFSEEQGERAE
jgi:uncharacterized alkaline shock family protein YloU